jgi:hypothetical protein
MTVKSLSYSPPSRAFTAAWVRLVKSPWPAKNLVFAERPTPRPMRNLSRRDTLRKLSIETGEETRFLPVTIDSYEVLVLVYE